MPGVGQRTEQTRGEVFIPAPHATQLRGRPAAKERRTHQPDDFPQELLLAAQAPFDLGHKVFRQPQIIEGLLGGFGGVLR